MAGTACLTITGAKWRSGEKGKRKSVASQFFLLPFTRLPIYPFPPLNINLARRDFEW